MKKFFILSLLLLGLFLALAAYPHAGKGKRGGRVLKLEELTYTDIDKLDRAKTIFFLTFGNLEEHGPHLPVGADYFQAIAVRDGLIARLRATHPDYDFVLFPVVPLGEGGANDLARQPEHIGTYAVRYNTLRDVAIDLGASVALKGFSRIFLLENHGTPLHNLAFTEAAAFVSERYGVRMVHITSFVKAEGYQSRVLMEKYLGKGWEERIGWEGHAGAAETSRTLFVRGGLVKADYKQLPSFVAKSLPEVLRTHERSNWLGYWGDPARATKEFGRELTSERIERCFRIAEMELAGEDLSKLPIYPDTVPALRDASFVKDSVERYAQQTAEIEAWLKKRQPAKP